MKPCGTSFLSLGKLKYPYPLSDLFALKSLKAKSATSLSGQMTPQDSMQDDLKAQLISNKPSNTDYALIVLQVGEKRLTTRVDTLRGGGFLVRFHVAGPANWRTDRFSSMLTKTIRAHPSIYLTPHISTALQQVKELWSLLCPRRGEEIFSHP